ncbi:FAD-binding oxidoreductase [Hugenholtzia roseola]|uniref:FAD-binding oxidoreductase n=1 Tax=Hugenholtzia roseola TaxID=1002 RepID=UPI00041DCBAE|nr:FAD-linked oxidase C-terminal domain-containing protein [Hugenholtzia roseola]
MIAEFQRLIGAEFVLTDDEARFRYSKDHTEDYSFLPDVVLKPANTEQVSQILRFCNAHHIPVTPRGGGTSLSGGALPVRKGVVLSMERFNRILDIDTLNLQATVETGVITEVFQEAVKEKGLFYPPDPASKGSCFIGGNVAHNSGGPKAVKYGVTRDYILNMEVVLPTGEIIWTGANVLKNSTGYNLTQLIAGSEGTLGVITKIVFKLRPLPTRSMVLLASFKSNEEAMRAISAIYLAGITPSGMEFMEREAIERTTDYLQRHLHQKVSVPLKEETAAQLIIELDGNDDEIILKDAERIVSVLDTFGIEDVFYANSQTEKDELWKVRRHISPAVNAYSLTKAEDVVVPRGNLPALITAIKNIGQAYGFRSVCYGHAGDGNLHVNVMKENIPDALWNSKINEGIGEIFKEVVRLGGMLSGEHGIGIAKKPYMPLAVGQTNLNLMRAIKAAFDPNGILNPDKIF